MRGNDNNIKYPMYGKRNYNQPTNSNLNYNECNSRIYDLFVAFHDSERANRRMAYENGILVTWSCRFCNTSIPSDKWECISCNKSRVECVKLDQRMDDSLDGIE